MESLTDEQKDVLIATMYVAFEREINGTVLQLRSIETRSMCETALLARNLLELQIWVEYLGSSKERAFDFYCESVRDLIDLMRRHFPQQPELKLIFEKSVQSLGTDFTHKITRVSAAAERVEKKGFYDEQSKFLSKFMHRTALSLFLRFPPTFQKSVQRTFVAYGEQYASDASKALKASVMGDMYGKYRVYLGELTC
jgi:hypothetical protein